MRCSEALAPPRGTRAWMSNRNCAGCRSARRFSASAATASSNSSRPASQPAARPILTISTVERLKSSGLRMAEASLKRARIASADTGWPLALEVASNSRMTSATGNLGRADTAASVTRVRMGDSASAFVPATANASNTSGLTLELPSVRGPRDSSCATAAESSVPLASFSASTATQAARSPALMDAALLTRASAQARSDKPRPKSVRTARATSLGGAVAVRSNTASTARFAMGAAPGPAAAAASTSTRSSAMGATTSWGAMMRTSMSLFSVMPGSRTSAAMSGKTSSSRCFRRSVRTSCSRMLRTMTSNASFRVLVRLGSADTLLRSSARPTSSESGGSAAHTCSVLMMLPSAPINRLFAAMHASTDETSSEPGLSRTRKA
mmetsp:Transcript_1063/g.2314  ORF Transcript_1063/g.2314 Transcript_1063/m.2314 type:complete len:381 (+) Transcript_1063:341-1483(+)